MPLSDLTLLYRGPLASCNYACHYCPFAKQPATEPQLRTDRDQLLRFVDWLAAQSARRWSVFFTPRGEALIHRSYQDAVVRLAGLDHVAKVAIQTNLACRLGWLASCPAEKVGLWCSYHPGQVPRAEFLSRCKMLDDLGVRYSVGCVGLHESLDEIEHLRRELNPQTYLWVNAFKHSPGGYDDATVRRIERIDPWFGLNLESHTSLGRRCRCGTTVFSVSGDGSVRRCHFVDEVLGNLYENSIESLASLDSCPRPTCRCHIGYVHLEHLRLDEVFQDGILERAVPGEFGARNRCRVPRTFPESPEKRNPS